MGHIGLNCLDCFKSLLSDFCNIDAENLLIECFLCKDRIFRANCGLKFLSGICGAIGVFEWGLIDLFGCVIGDATVHKVFRGGDCEAIALIWICELS